MFLNRTHGFIGAIALLFVLSSCHPKVLKGLMEEEIYELESINGLIEFDQNNEAYYRAKIEAFDQKISGQLIIKKEDSSYRAVMITDFGLKVIDLEIDENGSYEVNHIMKHMDYDFVKESFALNLLMLLPNNQNDSFVFYSNENQLLIQYPPLNMIYYFNDKHIEKVERYRGKKKVWALASINKNAIIEIHQTNPPIFMSLKPID